MKEADATLCKSRYYGLNDFNLRWIAWNDWVYTANLARLLAIHLILLIFVPIRSFMHSLIHTSRPTQ